MPPQNHPAWRHDDSGRGTCTVYTSSNNTISFDEGQIKPLSYTSRVAVQYAVKRLRESGFHIAKITGDLRQFDIITWNRSQVIAVVIRAARTPRIGTFPEELRRLASIRTDYTSFDDIQFWLYHNRIFSRYQVCKGGALPISGGSV